jgi:periplasmic divalent cation tolerance protein
LLLLIKTKSALFGDAIEAIRSMHPYEIPEIVGSEFTAGISKYFAWIDSATR